MSRRQRATVPLHSESQLFRASVPCIHSIENHRRCLYRMAQLLFGRGLSMPD